MLTEYDFQQRQTTMDQQAVDDIVRQGPRGTFALAGLATAIVVALWLAFYFFAYLPRA